MSRRAKSIARMRTPAKQPQFFYLDSMYVNLCWAWGDVLEIPLEELGRLIGQMPPGHIVIARRMTASEVELLQEGRESVDHYAHARVVHSETARWARPKPR